MIARKGSRHAEERARVLRRRLYSSAKANPRRSYGVLYDKVCKMEVLREAWKQVARNRGSAGVDGKSIEWIREYGAEKYLEELRQLLVEERYHPKQVRRVYIPKPDGRKRPLGIPTVTDRVVQAAVRLVIEPLFEADFLDCSYGFRPGRSPHQAIRQLDGYLRGRYRWLVDVDLKSYFDTIPHEPLMKLVGRRVRDPRVLRLIRWWLKAGILEDGAVLYPEMGSPQGAVLSPLLSNVYLHELDREWRSRGPRARLIRFADDFVILCPTEGEVRREYEHLKRVVQGMQLALNAEKTRVVPVREGFDFLGFSYRLGVYYWKGNRREIMVKVPRAKAIKSMQARIKEVVKAVPLGKTVEEAVEAVNRCLIGWANYFRVSNMQPAMTRMVWHAGEQLRLFLRRKYQRKRSQCGTRWPGHYFHEQLGLYSVAELCRGS